MQGTVINCCFQGQPPLDLSSNACHHQAAEGSRHQGYPLGAALVNGIVSGRLRAVPPILWAACVMSKCKDNYSIFIRSIHNRERKFLEEHPPSAL